MSTWTHRLVLGLAVLALGACSSSADENGATSTSAAAAPTAVTTASAATSAPVTVGPSRGWTVTVTADSGGAPFALEQAGGPTVMSSLDQPVSVTLRATAGEAVVVSGSPNLFTTRLRATGTLDVIGPVCLAGTPTVVPDSACGSDPAVLPIGVAYAQVPAPKPTGPLVDATDVRLSLLVGGLKAGTYRLEETVSWFRPGAAPEQWKQTTVSIDFVVTGPG